MYRLAIVALCLAACEHRPRPPAPAPTESAPGAGSAAEPAPAPPAVADPFAGTASPRLVVLVVIDQFPDWALDRHMARLSPQGLLRRAIGAGKRMRAEYPYAVTLTAPGHATIATGVLPSEHGIFTNGVWSRARKANISVIDDGEHPIIGRTDVFAGPGALLRPTIGDVAQGASSGRAKVVVLSLKERASILLGGQRPTASVWYDKKVHGFTTSTYYGAVPGWVTAYQAEHPVEALLVPWQAEDPAGLAAAYGPDDADGESPGVSGSRAFPHDVRASKDPWGFLRTTPQLGDYLVDLAIAGAEAEQLGADEVPDLLAVSMSTVDYAGHFFGPSSWEYAEALRRADLALGRLIDRLAARGPIAVVVTADHGGAPLAESAEARAAAGEGGAGRIGGEAMTVALELALDAKLGRGDWVDQVIEPFVYLGVDGERRRADVVPAVLELVRRTPGVALAVDTAEARGWTDDADPVKRLAAASMREGMDGDVYILPRPQWVFDPEEPPGTGTNHGSPQPYDREVPLIIAGSGVLAERPADAVDARRIAPTVAALLGVPHAQRPGREPALAGLSGSN